MDAAPAGNGRVRRVPRRRAALGARRPAGGAASRTRAIGAARPRLERRRRAARPCARSVAASKRSVAYSRAWRMPPGAPRRCSERSNFAVPDSPQRSGLPARGRAAPGSSRAAFWSTNITWKSGVRLMSRAGSQLLDEALEGQVLVRVGAEAGRRARARTSSAERASRRRASTRSDERVDEEADERPRSRRASGPRWACPRRRRAAPSGGRGATSKAASSTMNERRALAPARARRARRRGLGRQLERARRAPRVRRARAAGDPSAGRGRRGAPASCAVHHASCRSSTSPESHRALPRGVVRVLHGQRRRAARAGPRGRPRTARRARARSTPIDQPSVAMWCMHDEEHVLGSARARTAARARAGRAARSKGRAAPRAAPRRGRRSRSASGSAARGRGQARTQGRDGRRRAATGLPPTCA